MTRILQYRLSTDVPRGVAARAGRRHRGRVDPLAEHLAWQHGVVSRAQALASGLAPHDLRRMVRRRELAPLHPGVYVDHTGEPTWLQRAWGAVLACSRPDGGASGSGLGAALAGPSAMRAADGPGRVGEVRGPVHVAVPLHRRVVAPAGVRVGLTT